MSRVFESAIENISKKSGYHYNFLVDMFNEMMNDEGQDFDWDQFEGISMEHDWWNYEQWCEQNGYGRPAPFHKSTESKVYRTNIYTYNGPVLEFDRIIADHWVSSTRAESEKKARSNLAYQFKKQSGRTPQSKITIPGKLNIIEGDEQHSGGNRH